MCWYDRKEVLKKQVSLYMGTTTQECLLPSKKWLVSGLSEDGREAWSARRLEQGGQRRAKSTQQVSAQNTAEEAWPLEHAPNPAGRAVGCATRHQLSHTVQVMGDHWGLDSGANVPSYNVDMKPVFPCTQPE